MTSPFKPHPVLGWSGAAGFDGEIPAYPGVHLKLDRLGWRSPREPATPSGKSVCLMGCSYVFGSGVTIGESFAGGLAERLPDVRVSPRALPGYGTVQAYHNLRREIVSASPPDLAVYCFLDVHLRRNLGAPAFASRFSRAHAAGYQNAIKLPRAGLDLYGHLETSTISRSEIAPKIAQARPLNPDPYYSILVTTRLLTEMNERARAGGVKFAIAVLRTDRDMDSTKRLLDLVGEQGIDLIDVAHPRSSAMVLSERDKHPNAAGHAAFADGLAAAICERI